MFTNRKPNAATAVAVAKRVWKAASTPAKFVHVATATQTHHTNRHQCFHDWSFSTHCVLLQEPQRWRRPHSSDRWWPGNQTQLSQPTEPTVFAGNQHRFFGTTANDDDPSGILTITLEGDGDGDSSSESTRDTAPETMRQRHAEEPSEFAVPIVVTIPALADDDEHDDDYAFVETWHFRSGDVLEKGDVLCTIATPDLEVGMQIDDDEAGILGEIHVQEGMGVPPDTPICTIYHRWDDNNDDN
jgi:biotin carboxyl carrier protein